VRAAYCEKLVIQPPFTLTEIEPTQVSSNNPKLVVIKGENLPPEVVVFFGDKQAVQAKSRPGRKEIEATPPKGLAGSVEVRVVAPDGRDARIALHFLTDPIPRPYYKHLDGQKFKAKRLQLGHIQAEVATLIGRSTTYIWQIENGLNKPSDDTYEKIANYFNTPLVEFLKESPKV
jgi:DNA-binding XRE family transcriptional regulator